MNSLQSGTEKLPRNLSLEGSNVGNEWHFWKQSFEDYIISMGQEKSTDKVKLSLLRNMMGSEAARIVATLPLSDGDGLVYSNDIQAIDKYANPRTNVVFDRFVFNGRQQQEGEDFDHFLTDCRRLLRPCGFPDVSLDNLENQLLCDEIVHGIRDKNVQEALLRQDSLTLENAIKLCQAGEQSKRQVEKINSSLQDVLTVHQDQNRTKSVGKPFYRDQKPNLANNLILCPRCQCRHEHRKCPAFGKTAVRPRC